MTTLEKLRGQVPRNRFDSSVQPGADVVLTQDDARKVLELVEAAKEFSAWWRSPEFDSMDDSYARRLTTALRSIREGES